MTMEELKKLAEKQKKTYPILNLVLEDMEKNPKEFEKYLKMESPLCEILVRYL